MDGAALAQFCLLQKTVHSENIETLLFFFFFFVNLVEWSKISISYNSI